MLTTQALDNTADVQSDGEVEAFKVFKVIKLPTNVEKRTGDVGFRMRLVAPIHFLLCSRHASPRLATLVRGILRLECLYRMLSDLHDHQVE